jgi:hypothetical protein
MIYRKQYALAALAALAILAAMVASGMAVASRLDTPPSPHGGTCVRTIDPTQGTEPSILRRYERQGCRVLSTDGDLRLAFLFDTRTGNVRSQWVNRAGIPTVNLTAGVRRWVDGERVRTTNHGTVVSDPWCERSEDSCRINFRANGQWSIRRVTP